MSEAVFTRRRLLLTAGAGLTLFATGCASDDDSGSGDGSSPTVRLGWFPAFHTVSAFIADGAGLFTEQKVNVEMISGDSGATLNNLLSAGQVDLTYGALETTHRRRGGT
jgi:ABC-type nitrate/sulfonate/bicarbonate transport system substrate-binding protein